MVNQELLDLLRCPACVKTSPGMLNQVREVWLVCTDCGRKYPIVEDIPVMLISEGDRWKNTTEENLPVPPPRPQ
jgi:uncharacterized protein YbaR (Trm112 family)